MAEGGVLSYSTHRYLIVHTWVGLKHSDTMGHTHTEGERRREGRHKTGGNGTKWKKNIKPKKILETNGNEELTGKKTSEVERWKVTEWLMELATCSTWTSQMEIMERKTNTYRSKGQENSLEVGEELWRVGVGERLWLVGRVPLCCWGQGRTLPSRETREEASGSSWWTALTSFSFSNP